MLERAWEMKAAIRKWLNLDVNRRRYAVLVMKDEEWGLVDDLLKILQPFSLITTAIGTTLDVSIHQIFQLYNWLFEQLEVAKETWKTKARNSKYADELLRAIEAAHNKLAEYYGKTDGDSGTFYNLGAILNPSTKLSLYEVSSSLLEPPLPSPECLYSQGKTVPKTPNQMLTVYRMIKSGVQSSESNTARTF
jgi:hypothetical protein